MGLGSHACHSRICEAGGPELQGPCLKQNKKSRCGGISKQQTKFQSFDSRTYSISAGNSRRTGSVGGLHLCGGHEDVLRQRLPTAFPLRYLSSYTGDTRTTGKFKMRHCKPHKFTLAPWVYLYGLLIVHTTLRRTQSPSRLYLSAEGW